VPSRWNRGAGRYLSRAVERSGRPYGRLFAAYLFVRSLGNLRAVDLGLDPADVVVLGASPERSGYSRDRASDFYREWPRRAKLTPGVASASLAVVTILSESSFAMNLTVPEAEPRGGPKPNNLVNVVTSDYVRTIGLDFVAGRGFVETDGVHAPPVAIVNERFAEYYWPGRSPLRRRFRGFGRNLEVLGVVRTARYQSVREERQPTFYVPFEHRPLGSMTLHARVPGDAAATIVALARAAREIDPAVPVPVHDAATLADHVDARLANERLLNALASLFAALALVVAAAGLYGLVAYAVARLVREVGIGWRSALGVSTSSCCSSAGCCGSSSRAWRSARCSPSSWGASSARCDCGGHAGCIVIHRRAQPALRATRISPMVALRAE
jgi:hypothetical protein